MTNLILDENTTSGSASISPVPSSAGFREVLAIALPMIVSHAAETVMVFTDRLYLSKLGPTHANAAMLGGLTVILGTTFFIGILSYATALVAQNLGAGKKGNCSRTLTQAIVLALIAYPLVLCLIPLGEWFFTQWGLASEQIAHQSTYFRILMLGTIISLVRTAFACYFSGLGRTRVVMFSALLAMVVNIGANYLLIFGRPEIGIPQMGIRGAAYGTILGGVCGVLVLLLAYLRKQNLHEFMVRKSLCIDTALFRTLLRKGTPCGIEFFLNMLAFEMMVATMQSYSPVVASATTYVFSWDMVSFVPLLGLEIAVMSLVGRYIGAQEPDVARRCVQTTLKLGWIYSAIILCFFVFLPELLINVFKPPSSSAEAQLFTEAFPLAVAMLRLASIYVLGEAIFIVFVGALRGAGDTFVAMLLTVSTHWLLVFLLYFAQHWGATPLNAWLVLVIVFLLGSIPPYLRYCWKFLGPARGKETAAGT